ncbi:hypothetical protein CLU79DRAFT_777271 [Phycomyces nitens]|nr:hypothetical protein CLU79DRAFT_777271 [Phycomyces nitens]
MDNFKRASAIAIVVSTLMSAPLVQGAYLPQSSWDAAAHSDSFQKRALSDQPPPLPPRDTKSTDNDELDQNETEGSAIAEDGAPHTSPPYDQTKDVLQQEPAKPTVQSQLYAAKSGLTAENAFEKDAVKNKNEESLSGEEKEDEDMRFSNEQTAYYDNEVFDDMPEDLTVAEDLASNRANPPSKLAIASDRDELEYPGLGYAVDRLPIPAPASAAHAFDIDQNDASDLGNLSALSFLSQPEREEIRTLIKSQEEEAVQELEHEITATLNRAVYVMSKSRPAPWTDDPIELYQAYTRPLPVQSPVTDTKQRALGRPGSTKQKTGRSSASTTRFSKGPQEYPIAFILIIVCLLIWVILKVPSLKKLVSCAGSEKTSLPFHHSTKTKTID